MKTGAKTDIGRVRKLNEDSFNVVTNDSYTYAIVADGMGGHLAGEIASSMAVNIITEYIDKNVEPEMDRFQVKENIHRAFKKANEDIYLRLHRIRCCTDLCRFFFIIYSSRNCKNRRSPIPSAERHRRKRKYTRERSRVY